MIASKNFSFSGKITLKLKDNAYIVLSYYEEYHYDKYYHNEGGTTTDIEIEKTNVNSPVLEELIPIVGKDLLEYIAYEILGEDKIEPLLSKFDEIELEISSEELSEILKRLDEEFDPQIKLKIKSPKSN